MALVNAAGIKLSNFKNILTMQATRDCCGAGHLIVLRRKQQQRPRANRSLSPSLSAPAFHHYYITVFQYSSGPSPFLPHSVTCHKTVRGRRQTGRSPAVTTPLRLSSAIL
jgi:hypothetical protein